MITVQWSAYDDVISYEFQYYDPVSTPPPPIKRHDPGDRVYNQARAHIKLACFGGHFGEDGGRGDGNERELGRFRSDRYQLLPVTIYRIWRQIFAKALASLSLSLPQRLIRTTV